MQLILKKLHPGTIRADFADSIDANAVHGSDSLENAAQEIAFFFEPHESVSKRLIHMTAMLQQVNLLDFNCQQMRNFLSNWVKNLIVRNR